MKVSIIAAMSSNRVIGRGNALPWRLKPDLQRFKRLTMGGALIMGRRTFESIGDPLPGRRTIVLTRRGGLAAEGVMVARSLDEAFELAGDLAAGREAFIAGGADIYRQTIDRADRLYLTLIERDYEGDVFFPAFDLSRWRLIEEQPHAALEGRPPFRFLTYERIPEGVQRGAR